MAGPNVPDGAMFLVEYDGIYLGQQVLNTFHYSMALSGSSADLTTVYSEFRDSLESFSGMSSPYSELFTDQVTDIKLHIQMIHPVRYVRDTLFSAFPSGLRTAGSVNPPPNACVAFTLRSLLAGPHEKGTKHILASHPDDTEDGQVGSVLNGLLATFGALAIMPVTLGGTASGYTASPVIFNRTTPGASKFVESFAVQPHARILRRRTVGLGT